MEWIEFDGTSDVRDFKKTIGGGFKCTVPLYPKLRLENGKPLFGIRVRFPGSFESGILTAVTHDLPRDGKYVTHIETTYSNNVDRYPDSPGGRELLAKNLGAIRSEWHLD